MTEIKFSSIKGDRALGSGDDDKLGFRDVAKRIATSLVDRGFQDGLVVGIEGAWGSGKSSLLFLIGDELALLPESQQPSVINFRPWMIGDRDALVTSLFEELSSKLDGVALSAGDATPTYKTKAEQASEALRSFMNALSSTGALIEVMGDASGLIPVKLLGRGVKALGDISNRDSPSPQLSALKDNLVQSLRDLDHRFVVTIDDVDRLEPSEAIEVLRLVRSVVDLPNVIYLLCYDRDVLAQSIEKSAGVHSGKAFLEKIVQLTIMVPKPEPLQLRQWFSDGLHRIASVKNEDELDRLKLIIDHEGGRQLRTPRSVIRALDAIRFFWPPLREVGADLADLVWIQLIKDGNPGLYRWIEEYCATMAAVSVGTARVGSAEKKREREALDEIVPKNHFDDEMYQYYFAAQLPGAEIDYIDGGNHLEIFKRVSEEDRDEAIRNKRLSSPDHYRLYFALAGPSHALSRDDLESMRMAVGAGTRQTAEAILRLHSEIVTGSLTKADLLLERLKGNIYGDLAEGGCKNLLVAFSCVMDEAFRTHPFDHFWVNSLWDRADRLIPLLLSGIPTEHREPTLETMFRDGKAIGWLTSVFRKETFAHGRYGENPRPEYIWLLREKELDGITKILLDRYQGMSASDVFACPSPIDLLFAWRQGGDKQGPCKLIEDKIKSDEGFMETLEHFLSEVSSSDRGRFKVLKEANMREFMDYRIASKRVEKLKADTDLGTRAQRLSEALELGADY
jgi:hypothetical protein